MICYIKSFKDFKTIAKYDAVAYSLTDGEDGSVTIYEKNPIELTTKYTGCWLVIGGVNQKVNSLPYSYTTEVDESGGIILNITGNSLITNEIVLGTGGLEYNINSVSYDKTPFIFYISGASPSDDSLTLTIKHPIYAFDRAVLYDNSTIYGTLIANILNNHYGVNCPDSEYAMTYMSVSNTDNTECTITTDNYGYVVPSDIFEMARQDGVIIDFRVTSSNTLAVNISTANYQSGVVVFGDGHSQLQSESYDASYCAKATVLQELPDEYFSVIQSDIISGRNNIRYAVEIAQDIAKSKETGKICLAARFNIEWPESSLSEPDPYTNNILNIWQGTSTQGTQVLVATPGWERTPEAGSVSTEYAELLPIDDTDSLSLYCVCRADGGNGTNQYLTFTTMDYTKSSDIQVGPVMEDSQSDKGIFYRVLDYYLKKDKTVTKDPPTSENRMPGAWHIFECGSSESPMYVALGAFSGNSDNHKIEFYSDKKFEYYQPMILRLRGEVLETIITSRAINRNDGRYFYKCGNLMTTLTDHIRNLEKQL